MILESAAVLKIIDLEWQNRCAFSLYFLSVQGLGW